jgi:hypothetical protein
MPKDRRERIKLGLDIAMSLGELLGGHVLRSKYDGMMVVVVPIVGYDASLILEAPVQPGPGIGRQHV